MSESKIGDIVSSLLSGVHSISKSETIVGEPQQAGESTIIPVHRLKIAFGAGSASAGARSGKAGGKSGGYGAGGAVELDPVAVIAISKLGHAHLMTVDGDEGGAWSALLHDVPDILSRLAQSIGDRFRGELGARQASPAGVRESPSAELNAPNDSNSNALSKPKDEAAPDR